MRKTILALATLLFCSTLLAQAPQLMSYQAVVRNGNNQLLSNAPVGMRISVLQGSANGNVVYSETHSVTTNAQGLATLSVGGGTPQSGTFAGIDWANGPYFLKAETDPAGGSNYTITATSQLMSVPYALYATRAGVAANGVPSGSQPGEVLTNCGGVPTWTIGGECPGSISTLNCDDIIHSGELIVGYEAVGVTSLVPYTGGSGGVMISKQFESTGVTGLIATINQGKYQVGNGKITCNISGKPSEAGTANFTVKINEKVCTLARLVQTDPYPSKTIHCGVPTAIVDITNPFTGRTWMDRNLGASQSATSISDTKAFGDLYQWGRPADGHQCRNSPTISTPSSTEVPTHGSFISQSSWGPVSGLWNIFTEKNNPCPSGYRVPTNAEWQAETATWGIGGLEGLSASILKLPAAGYRSANSILYAGEVANYWTSEFDYFQNPTQYIKTMTVYSSSNQWNPRFDAGSGLSVRCIKENIGTISAIDCEHLEFSSLGSNFDGDQIQFSAEVLIPYTGGNGGVFKVKTVNSTGVTGLTLTINGGYFALGSGKITCNIGGNPSYNGIANFVLNIGTQICTLKVVIPASNPPGFQRCNYDGYAEVTNPSTGRVWMDRNLGAYQTAYSSSEDSGDLYQWGRYGDKHQCRYNSQIGWWPSNTDRPNHSIIINSNGISDWRSPKNDNLWQGVAGINNPCPIGFKVPSSTEWNIERESWSQNNSVGAFSSLLKLPVAYDGYWSSTVDGNDAQYFSIWNNGSAIYNSARVARRSVRCIKETSVIGMVSDLSCGSAIVSGSLFSGSELKNVKVEIPYSGGNGLNFPGGGINSTEVTGLVALYNQGFFAVGAGSLSLKIKGTPLTGGDAKFMLNIGGKSCTVSIPVVATTYSTGTVHCKTIPTAIVNVINPTTGKTWMDRNLGAVQAAQSPVDTNSYGDQYQWGRRSDGHQCRKSPTITQLSSSIKPDHGQFIYLQSAPDWCTPQNHDLWQGASGLNNPCPDGYRVPTSAEWTSENLSWDNSNPEAAYASVLKLPKTGFRYTNIVSEGYAGYYWSSSKFGGLSRVFYFDVNSANRYIVNLPRNYGYSIRCIKD